MDKYKIAQNKEMEEEFVYKVSNGCCWKHLASA